MRIFPAELEVGDLEGFTPEKDLFGRKGLGLSLVRLFRSLSQPTVLAVDAPWGAGKTAFLKMWAGELRKDGIPVVFFDAYEHDFSADAFTAITSHVVTLVRDKAKENTTTGQKFLQSAKSAGKILLRSGLRLGVKVATLNAVDTKELEESLTATADELSELTDTYVGELITKHKEQTDTFREFRDSLSALPSLLSPQTDEASDARPLIFIIDELDRCRPVFALEVLERIKHFFSVPNVHFVLGTHSAQLRNSVTAAYGGGIDAGMYLQKFIHLTVHLLDESEHDHDRVITKYINYLRKNLDFDNENDETLHYTSETIRRIAEEKSLTLRTIERVMTNLALALAVTPKNRFKPAPIIAGLCILKVLAPDLFAKAKRGKLSYTEVADTLGYSRQLDHSPAEQDFDVKWWRFCTDPEYPEEFVQKMGSGMSPFYLSRGRSDIVAFVANGMIDRLSVDR